MSAAGSRHIVITDQAHGLPYSKGLMASSLAVSGLPALESFRIAERIESILEESGRYEVSSDELRDLAATLLSEVGGRYADSYLKWQSVQELDVPLILLIGGATGVGKSTAATQLAARLGFSRIISTDAVREVLRSAFSRDLMPTLYESSFEAGRVLRAPLPKTVDKLLLGFQEQVSAVAVGVRALIDRAVEEGTDMIIEGAHIVPGFLDEWREELKGAVLIQVVMQVADAALHRSHLHVRSLEMRSNRHDHYLASFERIRTIQEHIVQAATDHGAPVIDAFDLDSTLQDLTNIVIADATSRARDGRTAISPEAVRIERREPDPKRKHGRVRSWELVPGRRRRQ